MHEDVTPPAVAIRGVEKTYASGFRALHPIDLEIRQGEIFALLGPNGAGKTTLINIVCGIVTASAGEVLVEGKNWQDHYREARTRIGLVPQEINFTNLINNSSNRFVLLRIESTSIPAAVSREKMSFRFCSLDTSISSV